MNFNIERKKIDDDFQNVVMIADSQKRLISYLVMISYLGLERANTGYPQPEVDYDPNGGYKKYIKITGIDLI